MPRLTFTRTAQLHSVAQAQAGLITASQLAQLGMSTSTTSARSRAGGMWTRVLPSVHLITGGTPDAFQRDFAALLYCGDDAILTGFSALRYHGLVLSSGEDFRSAELVHILLPHRRRAASKGFVLAERTRQMPDTTQTATDPPLRIASVARAVADAARHCRDRGDVQALVAEATRRGLTRAEDIEDVLNQAPRQGSAHLRYAVSYALAGAWSGPEGDLLELMRATGLPEPLLNRRLILPSGRVLAIPDAWLDDVGLAIEVDSQRHHASHLDLERTTRRNAAYARAGVHVLTLTPRQIRTEPEGTAMAIAEAHRAAARSPRPDVRATDPVIRNPEASTGVRWAG